MPAFDPKRTSEPARVLPSAHQLRQLSDIRRNPPPDYAASSISSQPVKASRNLSRRSVILSAVIGSGWDCSRALKASSISSKSVLPSSRFSIGGTPDQAAAAGQHYRDQGLRKSSGSLAIRRASSLVSNLAAAPAGFTLI